MTLFMNQLTFLAALASASRYVVVCWAPEWHNSLLFLSFDLSFNMKLFAAFNLVAMTKRRSVGCKIHQRRKRERHERHVKCGWHYSNFLFERENIPPLLALSLGGLEVSCVDPFNCGLSSSIYLNFRLQTLWIFLLIRWGRGQQPRQLIARFRRGKNLLSPNVSKSGWLTETSWWCDFFVSLTVLLNQYG